MQIIADPKRYIQKEQLYYDVRNKEGRIITDDVLLQLPYVDTHNPHKNEWDIRASSLDRFKKYLQKCYHLKKLNIVDIGCGNGWMTHQLYKEGYSLTGLDLNMAELMQAEKVFGTGPELKWVYADIMSDELTNEKFDIILFGASCQYFEDIALLTKRLCSILKQGGEIHLLDSIFYKKSTITEAGKRSKAYYDALGYPEMNKYYFHHNVETIKGLGYKKLYPGMFSKSPLQWWKLIRE